MKKIAIAVQRYGLEVNGGSELLARLLAEKLSCHYDIEVITTCALDYTTWKNHYPQGVCEVNGVKVNRFAVDKPRDLKSFAETAVTPGNVKTEQEWIDKQGPYCPKVIDFIRESKDKYDVFVFVTYLYYLTVRGINEVKDKAILVPTAHDEPPIYFSVYKEIFNNPRAIIFCSEEERSFTHGLFGNHSIPNAVAGIGIDIPNDCDSTGFKERHGLSKYILYAGRIDDGKNCSELFKYFIEYKKRNPSGLKLVLMGKEYIKVPRHRDILSLGFVSDKEKNDGMAGAELFVLPSVFESFSIAVLESMSLGVPVIVNGKCEVAKGHCVRSNAGLYYNDYFEFEGCMNYLINNEEINRTMKENAIKYVEENYRWDVIIEKYIKIIERCTLPI